MGLWKSKNKAPSKSKSVKRSSVNQESHIPGHHHKRFETAEKIVNQINREEKRKTTLTFFDQGCQPSPPFPQSSSPKSTQIPSANSVDKVNQEIQEERVKSRTTWKSLSKDKTNSIYAWLEQNEKARNEVTTDISKQTIKLWDDGFYGLEILSTLAISSATPDLLESSSPPIVTKTIPEPIVKPSTPTDFPQSSVSAIKKETKRPPSSHHHRRTVLATSNRHQLRVGHGQTVTSTRRRSRDQHRFLETNRAVKEKILQTLNNSNPRYQKIMTRRSRHQLLEDPRDRRRSRDTEEQRFSRSHRDVELASRYPVAGSRRQYSRRRRERETGMTNSKSKLSSHPMNLIHTMDKSKTSRRSQDSNSSGDDEDDQSMRKLKSVTEILVHSTNKTSQSNHKDKKFKKQYESNKLKSEVDELPVTRTRDTKRDEIHKRSKIDNTSTSHSQESLTNEGLSNSSSLLDIRFPVFPGK